MSRNSGCGGASDIIGNPLPKGAGFTFNILAMRPRNLLLTLSIAMPTAVIRMATTNAVLLDTDNKDATAAAGQLRLRRYEIHDSLPRASPAPPPSWQARPQCWPGTPHP